MEYNSTATLASVVAEGVSFTITRMSFGRRIELTRRIRELGRKVEFLEAGEDFREKIEATLVASEVDKLYIEWGLQQIEGLQIDGQAATPEILVSAGPEELCKEIVAAIRTECGLNEEERKN